MADSRIVRIGILSSDRVNMLNWEEEVFYRRLMSIVDDFGRYDARPSVLRCQLYPLKLDKMSEASIQRCLTACEAARLVRLYSVEGKPYVEINNFGQRVQSKSKWPDPPDGDKQSSTVINGDPPSSTVYTESESETYTESNINNSHAYSEKPDLSVCVPPERLNPHSESDAEGFARFVKAVCDLRPTWQRVMPNCGEIGVARELYNSVKGAIKPSDFVLLKAYFDDFRTAKDRHGEKFWRPDGRKAFIENFAGILASAERWRKETRWRPAKAMANANAKVVVAVDDDEGEALSVEEAMALLDESRGYRVGEQI
ncbi:MAG: hypothetical protein RSE01_09245 [Akkermansia sp.]